MSRRILAIVLLWCLAVPASGYAQVTAKDNCLKGCPTGAPATDTLIARSIYALSNNPLTKFADWVAYKVSAANLNGPSRNRNWAVDPDLDPKDTLAESDYDDAYDALDVNKGHQAPLAAFSAHPDWRMTNYLSNITPQSTKLNQGPWKNLEDAVRKLAENSGKDVYVVTGPLYEWPMAKLPATDKVHRVPSAYWKVVALQVSETDIRVAAFYFYQDTPRRADYCDHMKTVDFIEKKSGLDFFPDFDGAPAMEAAQPTLTSELGCP